MSEESLLKFPTDFMIKIIGHANENFVSTVEAVVLHHFPEIKKENISQRASKGEQYTSLTVTVYAQSQQQLDALYQELHKLPDVVMML